MIVYALWFIVTQSIRAAIISTIPYLLLIAAGNHIVYWQFLLVEYLFEIIATIWKVLNEAFIKSWKQARLANDLKRRTKL